MPLGGIEQWVTIKGGSCANPVILFLDGGPGNTLSPYADSIYGSWEKDFTLVQWDQRGAGRTYGRNAPPADPALEALGPPPWENPRNSGVLRRATRAYEAKTSIPAPKSWWLRAPAYDTPQVRAEYLEGEDHSYLQFVGRKGDGMFSRVDLPGLGAAFEVPVFIIQGSEDLVAIPEVARRYFDGIAAPQKEFVVVPHTGHDPNVALVEAQYRIMTERVRPLTKRAER